MTVYQDQIEEHLWYNTYMQGNVNVAGLIYDDALIESWDFVDVVYTVNVDMVESGIGFSESFDPFHLMFIDDGFNFREVFGFPSRIKQAAINVIHQPIVSPIDLCHMQIDIVHGVDTYWEEIGDNMHFPTESDDVAKVAFWFNAWCYESLNLEFEMAPGTPGVWKAVYPSVSDLINMRHELDALWYFNNLSDEKLFTYDKIGWAWGHEVEEGFVITDNVQRYLGFKAIEYLFLKGGVEVSWIGNKYLEDNIFVFDEDKCVHGFNEQNLESFLLEDDLSSPFLEKLMEEMDLSGENSKTIGEATLMVEGELLTNDKLDMIRASMVLIDENLEISGSIN
jgi:hypothetical protein